MSAHFEDLWEKCEQLQNESAKGDETSLIVDELIMKLNMYGLVDVQKDNIPKEECDQMKSQIFGELLLTLTRLSLKDNIDVYKALHKTYEMLSIEHYGNKHRT